MLLAKAKLPAVLSSQHDYGTCNRGSFYIRTAVACSNHQELASRILEYHLPLSITPALERPRAISDHELSEDSQPSTSGRSHSRPASHGRITPSRLASLSEVLGMPLPMLQRLLEVSPVLLTVEPPHLQQQLRRQAEELGLPIKAVVHMVCHQPGLMVRAKDGQLRAAVEALAVELGIGSDKVVRWVAVTPSVMRHHPKVVRRRLEKLAALVGLKGLAPAVRLVAAAPQYITDSYGSIERRLAEMSQVLRRPLRQVQNMVAREPKLPFLGTRIFTNRLKILQAILQKQYRHIVTLAVKCPALVVSDMETARQVYHGLGKLLGMEQGVVYAMVCHCPELLRVSLPRLAQRQRRLARALQVFPAWELQWKALNPALRADCLMCTATTYHRLEFLLLAQQAASVSLVDALRMARVDFSRRWPGFEVAMERAAARKLAERLTTGQHEHQPVHRLRVGRSSRLGRAGLSQQGSWQQEGASSRRTGNGAGWGWGEAMHDGRSHRQGSSEWRHGAASGSALHARLAEPVDRTKREVKRRRRRVEQAQQQERELSWQHQAWQQQQQQEAPDNLDEEQSQDTTQDGLPSMQGSGGEAYVAAALSRQHGSDEPMQWQQPRDQPPSERHCSMADTPAACGAASSAHAPSPAAQAAADDSHASSLNGAASSSSSLNGALSHQQTSPLQHAPSGHSNGFSSDDSSHASSNGYHPLELHNLNGYVQLAPNRSWGHASDISSSALAVSAVMGSPGMEAGQQATQLTAHAHYMDHICGTSSSSSTGLEGEGSSASSTGHLDGGAHSAGGMRGNGSSSSSSIGKAQHGFDAGGSSRTRNGKGKERREASRQQNELASAVGAGVVMAHSKHGPA